MQTESAASAKDHISVCVCTFRRAELLKELLGRLENQVTQEMFTYSVVVADNDKDESAKRIVESFCDTSHLTVKYCVESVQNIALARNKAIQNSDGNLIAFIDDDEFPVRDWLLNLLQTKSTMNVEGVLGPVRPYFEIEPPEWIVRGQFFERPRHPTGFKMNWNECRTGNVLFAKQILDVSEPPFRSQFDTAGEDVDFFWRMSEKGCKFVWCDEAVVYEVVPQSRSTARYLLGRSLLRGSNFPKQSANKLKNAIKSLVAIPAYAVCLPFLALFGKHVFMRYLIKFLDHFSRLMAFAGIKLATLRKT